MFDRIIVSRYREAGKVERWSFVLQGGEVTVDAYRLETFDKMLERFRVDHEWSHLVKAPCPPVPLDVAGDAVEWFRDHIRFVGWTVPA